MASAGQNYLVGQIAERSQQIAELLDRLAIRDEQISKLESVLTAKQKEKLS